MKPQQKQIFSTAEAAKYLGLTVGGLKHHIYLTQGLSPNGKIGKTLYFTKDNLDGFNKQRRKVGRPPQPFTAL